MNQLAFSAYQKPLLAVCVCALSHSIQLRYHECVCVCMQLDPYELCIHRVLAAYNQRIVVFFFGSLCVSESDAYVFL